VKRLSLTRDTVGTVARGHPWVYREGVRGSAAVGEPVELVDDRGKRVAWGLFDQGPVAVRVLGRDPEPIPALLQRRLARASQLRGFFGEETNAWRACNGEGDGLGGLVVDRYGSIAVLRLYSRVWERHLDAVCDAVRALGWAECGYRRLGVGTVDGRAGGEVLWGAAPPEVLEVREHGMRLLVRVEKGQKTGLFLDQREHRRLVRGWAAGRSVLNLFAYNGGFSVAAALGGARRVVSVDRAPEAIEDARAIFRLNGLDPDRHGFEVADVFGWSGAPAELVVVDPPSLAHAQEADAAARKAYRDLHRRVGPLALHLLATSSCTARLAWERWEEAVREGLKGEGSWQRLHVGAEPIDHPTSFAHPEARYLKFLLLGRLDGAAGANRPGGVDRGSGTG